MQSIERINLEKLKKCDQIWEDMLPNEKGRICAKCQHTIIDFRGLNDKEVAKFIIIYRLLLTQRHSQLDWESY